ERVQQLDERACQLNRGRLVGNAYLERPEARVRSDIPPEAGIAVGQSKLDEPLDERLPLRVGSEVRRGCRTRELREHCGTTRGQARLLAAEKRRVGREREKERQPGEHAFERLHALVQLAVSRRR